MRRVLAIAALALLVAPSAAAKEITGAEICGADGCRTVAIPKGLHDFPGGGGGGLAATPPMGPFVEVRLDYDGGLHREEVWYVPEARVFAMPDGHGSARWMAARDLGIDPVLVEAAAGVVPHRPRVTAAFVGGEAVEGGVATYSTLFSVDSGGPVPGYGAEVDAISVRTEPPSPWAAVRLWFYPESGLLQRGIDVVELPAGVAADLRDRRAIRSVAAGGAGFDWSLVTGSLLLAALLGTAVLLAARRARHLPA